MDKQLTACLCCKTYCMTGFKNIDHFTVARCHDLSVGRFYRNRCSSISEQMSDHSPERAERLFHLPDFRESHPLPSSFTFSSMLSVFPGTAAGVPLHLLRSGEPDPYRAGRKSQCNSHCDNHLDQKLNRCVKAEQNTEDTRNACSLCSKMYDRCIQCSASSSDTSCDKRFKES